MKKIKLLRTHTPLHIPDVGDLGVLLPHKSKQLESLTMELDSSGAFAMFVFQGKLFNVFIPAANIVIAELEVETKQEPKFEKKVK